MSMCSCLLVWGHVERSSVPDFSRSQTCIIKLPPRFPCPQCRRRCQSVARACMMLLSKECPCRHFVLLSVYVSQQLGLQILKVGALFFISKVLKRGWLTLTFSGTDCIWHPNWAKGWGLWEATVRRFLCCPDPFPRGVRRRNRGWLRREVEDISWKRCHPTGDHINPKDLATHTILRERGSIGKRDREKKRRVTGGNQKRTEIRRRGRRTRKVESWGAYVSGDEF